MQTDRLLSPHFFLSEFTSSQTAVRLGIRNEPQPQHVENLARLALALEEARAALDDATILLNSGYRSPVLNIAVLGSPTSAHCDGRSADFTAPAFGTPRQICQHLVDHGLLFDQLILEGDWVHLAIPELTEPARNEVLTAHFVRGKRTTYTQGLA